ncbi:hypothetical protein [Vibrio sp.]|uniref:hypothetical protein n=1 Tax=Vibrio sp. TaxID=678 RepID=UPI003D0E4D17
MTYEQWAIVADCYTPILAGLSAFIIYRQTKLAPGSIQGAVMPLFFTILLAYTVMLVDDYMQLWPSFGADFSTHTAIALVFVMHLILNLGKTGWLVLASLLAYCHLMYFQGYHSYLDMVTTAVFFLPMFWAIFKYVGTPEPRG